MEAKLVILSVFIISLVLGQFQVEAKICCPSTTARNIFNTCRFAGGSRSVCATLSGCKIISGNTCPAGYTHFTLENLGDAVIEYCNLGCESSVCGALATLQNSGKNEIVNEPVETCTKTCSSMCTKRSITAIETA